MARRQRGYILIYALTILLFLVGTVTGAAYALRLNAQEAYQQRERLRAEFRLRGALQYALAQFALAAQAPEGWRMRVDRSSLAAGSVRTTTADRRHADRDRDRRSRRHRRCERAR